MMIDEQVVVNELISTILNSITLQTITQPILNSIALQTLTQPILNSIAFQTLIQQLTNLELNLQTNSIYKLELNSLSTSNFNQ